MMLIMPVACGCLIKQRCQPTLAGNCRVGLCHGGGETIPLWNCTVDEGVLKIVSSGWKFPHVELVLGSGARVTLLHHKVFRVHSYIYSYEWSCTCRSASCPVALSLALSTWGLVVIGRCWWVLWGQFQIPNQGVQRSGKSQGNSRLGKKSGKSQGILLKVREKINIGKSQGKVREFAFSAI